MKTIATARITSAAPAAAFFARWADMATWPEWNTDTAWVRLDGPFRTGVTGVLKPKGGPEVKFVVAVLEPGREFTDVSLLAGAKLTFRHLVGHDADGRTTVDVDVTLGGPLAFMWSVILAKGIRESLQADLDRLNAVCSAESAAVA
ncbi:MAG: hypothetical protein HOU81_13120 [Hamadaea sp.]|uniref:SRPBCC family protein n=1 Tax=Hamadaea sp. TaxID=2024425 RepID=UPI0017A9942E|nr:SRPBCC family protein [Hamadaea sp.]NUR71757.1 hypothetical protein [Hamadaea sp.]NUT19071.1 hypothetical protein [Hamadaea sp.]